MICEKLFDKSLKRGFEKHPDNRWIIAACDMKHQFNIMFNLLELHAPEAYIMVRNQIINEIKE